MKPKVSIIVPCYNYGEYIDEAVDSILNQTFQDFEVIIVNDGSTDEATNQKLDNYNKPKVKVIKTDNQGLPSARNNGIKEATGEYIACLDADDKFAPTFIEQCLESFEKDSAKKLGIVTTWVQTFQGKSEVWEMGDYDPIKLMVGTDGGIHVASMFRKETWEKVGGYPVNLSRGGYEDRSFWISIVAQGYKWECIKEPLFCYRVKENSMIQNALSRHDELFTKVIENNKEFYKENIIEIILYLQKQSYENFEKYKELRSNFDYLYKTFADLEKDSIEQKEVLKKMREAIPYKIYHKLKGTKHG